MATIAVGDVHGNHAALQSLLARVVPELGADDTLLFLGDYIDRGPDSKRCIDDIVTLRRDSPFEVVTLRGNHEEWMLATMRDPSRHSWLLGADAWETVRSYSAEAESALRDAVERAGERLITEDLELPYTSFFDAVPEAHRTFFEELRLWHQDDGAVFCHGGVDPHAGPIEEQEERVLTWGLTVGFPEFYEGPTRVVYGHWNRPVIDSDGWPHPDIRRDLTYGLDTISTGVLTAVRMPDGAVFQSERF